MTDVTTLTPPTFAFRSFIARAQLARGPVMRFPPSLEALAFVETPTHADSLQRALEACKSDPSSPVSPMLGFEAICNARRQSLDLSTGTFRLALIYSGLQPEGEQQQIEAAARDVCLRLSQPSCTYVPYEVCGVMCEEMQFARVMSFNLQVASMVSHESPTTKPPSAALASEALQSAASLFGTLKFQWLFVP
eukprot:CAMPEP_0172755488 /NCGR_PEP_ID=MMETSP1074-20121228/159935_1 /TAXON_ID=2916 /ORGANISM="Ceratium fusus, Strain PA161109" /LENGTH=191 /DNA_ID=CAMNT_0013588579 /DNA_START=39 /DNA_END=610 /DNA_ORIENTATION=+